MFGPQREDVFRQDALMREEDSATAETALEEPKTPTKNRVQNLWHGLPSPETPTFHGNTLEMQSAASSTLTTDRSPTTPTKNGRYGSRGPYKTRETGPPESNDHHDIGLDEGDSLAGPVTPKDDTERDAMLAQEFEAELSPTTTRRSTRLRVVPKPVCRCFADHNSDHVG
jgi:hypothetical protein